MYKFGEGKKEINATIRYSPLEELSSADVFELAGKEEKVTIKFLVDSKKGKDLKHYTLKRVSVQKEKI